MEHTAIDKALEVLFHLNAQPGPVGVAELGRALSLPRSSAHRLLSVLRRHDLVEQARDGRYQPGIGLLVLASGMLGRDPLQLAAQPVLTQAAAELGETFFLVAARAGVLRVLDKAEGTGVLRASPPLGSIVPAHATAVGKLYLAHAPGEVSLDPERPRYTERTLHDEATLGAEVLLAARRGYAHNHEEWIEGLSVLAAPLFSSPRSNMAPAVPTERQPRRLCGAICVALATARLSQLGQDLVASHLLAATKRIDARLQGASTP